ncbi:hypothetical protein EQM14_15790 [Caproiciproducens sp. NJN-50]|uniref:hypothetical protein n=1 Tax=Caproiciproducens sp. NJN-50 TaxID=2507162 RepID=UPI000FFE2711|nr:hypothetical protein [Caproiciproducens sp. NJN-50]QAT51113.1 hypothetical protein EQM14_15790 [Caproiciproducens sp. NJN-50]
MAYFMIFFPLYLVLAWISLRGTWKRKEFQYYWVQIPVLAAVLALNILIASGVQMASISSVLTGLFSNYIK